MCLKPWFNTKTGKTTPCGGCIGCRMDEQRLWTERTKSEMKKGRNAFLTLTYDEEHLHYKDGGLQASLDKEGIKKWLDNAKHQVKELERKKLLPEGCRGKFAYYLIGEYGGTFQRPHYHAIMLGLDWHDCQGIFRKLWKNGMIKSLPLEAGSIRYVLDYSMKNINGKLAEEMYDRRGVERPFRLTSKGYGKDYIASKAEEINRTGYIMSGNRKIIIPSYYKNMYLRYDEESIQSREAEKLEILRKRRERANGQGRTLEEDAEAERKAKQEAEKEKMRQQNKKIEIEYYNDWWQTAESILANEALNEI